MANKTNRQNQKRQLLNLRNPIALLLLSLIIVSATACLEHRAHERGLAAKPIAAVITFYGPSTDPNKSTSFTVNVKDAQIASAILTDAHLLSPSLGGSCPADDGAMYTMTFVLQKVTITAGATGCQAVKVSDSNGTYRADARFWKDVHQATGKSILPDSSARYYN